MDHRELPESDQGGQGHAPLALNPDRFRNLTTQFFRYFLVAGLGLIVDFGLLFLLTTFAGVNYLVSAAIGFICGLIVTYFMSERFVFEAPKIRSTWIRFAIFATIGLVGLGLVEGFMAVLVGGLAVPYLLAKVGATAVVYCWNFFARRALYS